MPIIIINNMSKTCINGIKLISLFIYIILLTLILWLHGMGPLETFIITTIGTLYYGILYNE